MSGFGTYDDWKTTPLREDDPPECDCEDGEVCEFHRAQDAYDRAMDAKIDEARGK